MKIKLSLLIALIAVMQMALADNENDGAKCAEAIDKSAVTPDAAAAAAAQAKKNPPIYSNEVYSSKVKSKSLIINHVNY